MNATTITCPKCKTPVNIQTDTYCKACGAAFPKYFDKLKRMQGKEQEPKAQKPKPKPKRNWPTHPEKPKPVKPESLLIKCADCGKEISRRAESCPHCGAPNDQPEATPEPVNEGNKETKKGILKRSFYIDKFLLLLVAAGLTYAFVVPGDPKQTTHSPQKTVAEKIAEGKACAKDAACWGEKNYIKVSSACVTAIEKKASYAVKWTDDWATDKFDRSAWGLDKNIIVFFGDKAMFQNGFGAWKNVSYKCFYDTSLDYVKDVEIFAN